MRRSVIELLGLKPNAEVCNHLYFDIEYNGICDECGTRAVCNDDGSFSKPPATTYATPPAPQKE